MKKLESVETDRNREDIKESRRQYAVWLNELQGRPEQPEIVFIDESGFNLWLARTRGRARAGQRAVRTVGGRKGPNFICIMAVSNTRGLIHTEFLDGGTNGAVFVNFLEEVSMRLGDMPATFYLRQCSVSPESTECSTLCPTRSAIFAALQSVPQHC